MYVKNFGLTFDKLNHESWQSDPHDSINNLGLMWNAGNGMCFSVSKNIIKSRLLLSRYHIAPLLQVQQIFLLQQIDMIHYQFNTQVHNQLSNSIQRAEW